MGSIAQDKAGNIALGFSLSGSTLNPSIRYTGRLAGDALGTMTQGDGTLAEPCQQHSRLVWTAIHAPARWRARSGLPASDASVGARNRAPRGRTTRRWFPTRRS